MMTGGGMIGLLFPESSRGDVGLVFLAISFCNGLLIKVVITNPFGSSSFKLLDNGSTSRDSRLADDFGDARGESLGDDLGEALCMDLGFDLFPGLNLKFASPVLLLTRSVLLLDRSVSTGLCALLGLGTVAITLGGVMGNPEAFVSSSS
mmetsp:Transcript_148337/g.262302  ORF Transcript_148337/g.262302 Transcript_148337/m.262302 type:complete len:149 (+) Transcript_148337:503-949(+)